MNDVNATGGHEERWLLDNVVTDVDDHVRMFDRSMHKVARRQRGVTKKAWVTLVGDALAHLRGHKRNIRLADELTEHSAGQLSISARTDHEQWMLRSSIRFTAASIDLSSAVGRRTRLV